MADTGIFATTLEVQEKAGANASAVANTEAYINSYMSQAESQINVDSEFNWSDVYDTLNVDVKKILTKSAAALAAIEVINYDPDAWSIETASFKRDTLYVIYLDTIRMLRETDKNQIFIRESA